MRTAWLVLGMAAVVAGAPPLRAQGAHLAVAAGVAIPSPAVAARRGTGFQLRGSAELGELDAGVRFRADAAFTYLPGRAGANEHLRIRSLTGQIVLTEVTPPRSPYILGGIGMHHMVIPGQQNPYGWVLGLDAGLGMRFDFGRVRAFAEIQGQLILSDYGNDNFELGGIYPIMVGVSF